MYLQIPDNSDPCTTSPISEFTIFVTITNMDGREETINRNVMESLETYILDFYAIFNEELIPNTTYCFNVSAQNEQKTNGDDGGGGKYFVWLPYLKWL